MRVLLDTNVILDIAQVRRPYYDAAARILRASDFDRIHLHVTASSATDIYYILRKSDGREAALTFLADLLKAVDVCSVDKRVLIGALGSAISDFEDAVQNAAAVESQITIIATRNRRDYSASPLTVMTPDEFVATHLT